MQQQMHDQKANPQRNDMMVARQQYPKKQDKKEDTSYHSKLNELISQKEPSSFLGQKRPHEPYEEDKIHTKKHRGDFTP